MSDHIGLLEFPPPPPGNNPVSDPLLQMVGEYVQTFINWQLGAEWSRLAPNEGQPIKYVTPASTRRAVFDDNRLPSLFVFRHATKPQRLADDLYRYDTVLHLLWVPPRVDGDKLERRAPFASKLGLAIDYALRKGRHPRWVLRGDTDTTAATRGTVLQTAARLCQRPSVSDIDYEPRIYIETPDKQQAMFEYGAVLAVVHVAELASRDPSLGAVPARLDAEVEQFAAGEAAAGTLADRTADTTPRFTDLISES